MSKKKTSDRSVRAGGLNDHKNNNTTDHSSKRFIKFLNQQQKDAYDLYQKNSILFLSGAAGCGKSFLSTAFAINDVLNRQKSKIYITRPLVEAGESLGFLPGDVQNKVEPFFTSIFDCVSKICGPKDAGVRSFLEKKIEIAPLAYLRGRTLEDCVCILDEAQNCTKGQLKLFLTRIGENCKMLITGDLSQSDLFEVPDLKRVLENLNGVEGIGHIHFDDSNIVRNPLISEIIKRI